MEYTREHYARQAAALEAQYAEEARRAEAKRRGRFQAAKKHLTIAGGSAILAVVAFFAGFNSLLFLVVTMAFGLSGLKKLIRAL